MPDVRYSVYRKKDGLPVAINATIPKCAKAMGITLDSFYSIPSRQRHGKIGTSREWKWKIIREGGVMATVYIATADPAKIKKAVQRKKSYMYACTSCNGEFYFCGTNCNYHYCPRCGRPFAGRVEDGK